MDLSSNCRLFVFTLTILATFVADQVKGNHRKLTTQLYGNDLAYVKAEGQSDTLHYLFSGYNEMSILSIKSTLSGKLDINTTFSPPRIEVKPATSVFYAFGIVFNKLIEYNDIKDSANIKDYKPETWKNHSTSMEIVSAKDNTIIFLRNITVNNVTGNVTFSFQNFVDDSRQDILPHLIVISNSSLIDIEINKVKPSFNNSRFAFATSYISKGKKSRFSLKSEKSLDDEYTPGTFEVTNWRSVSNNQQSFLQWKPVCYFDTSRSTMTSTYVKSYTTNTTNSLPSNDSLVYNFFATGRSDYNLTSNIISFGLSEDKFYGRNDYTAWSATIGYGVPPAEKVSTMAIAIISVGLGIPVLLFVGGGIYLCVKRRRSGYQQVFGTISS